MRPEYETARRACFAEMEFRLRFFKRFFDNFHLIEPFLTAVRHTARRHTCFVARDEIFQTVDLLLLTCECRFLLFFADLVHLEEVVIASFVACQFCILYVIDNIDDTVEERDIVRNENKRILIVLQICRKPLDMLCVEIVRRLVEDKDRRILEKELRQEHLRTLTARQVRYIAIETDIS